MIYRVASPNYFYFHYTDLVAANAYFCRKSRYQRHIYFIYIATLLTVFNKELSSFPPFNLFIFGKIHLNSIQVVLYLQYLLICVALNNYHMFGHSIHIFTISLNINHRRQPLNYFKISK